MATPPAAFSPSPAPNPAWEEALCRLVRERTGIRILDHQLDTLRRTAAEGRARFGHASDEAYLEALRQARASAPEHEHLIAGITVGESYFFRDQAQMAFLRDIWLPALIARRRQADDLHLRVWSAGCADGQELYSIAMLLADLLPDLERWNLHLLGTDLNVTALARALRGRYSEWSLRATPEPARRRYFRQENDGSWAISPVLRGHARYAYLNLREDSFPSMLSETVALDLILCRNVFIYFDPAIVTQVMAKFHASLVPDGCLLLGASDLVDSTTLDGYTLHALENAFWLQRRDIQHDQRTTSLATTALATPSPASAAPAARATTTQRPLAPTPAAATPRPSAPTAPAAGHDAIIRLLGLEAWQPAMELIQAQRASGDDSALIWQFQAKVQANQGQAREALEACDASLARDATDKHSHYLRAMVLLELHRLPAAEEALRSTLYLDRNFVEAHYQLGLLQMRRGRHQAGLKSMRNALAIAERSVPERRLHDAAGRDHERMADILRHELRIYEQRNPSHAETP